MKTIGIVGAGQMGGGIAQIASQCGFEVILHDIKEEFVAKGMATIEKNLDRMVKKEKITADQKAEALGRIKTITDLSAFKGADIVIEAATENFQIKTEIFKKLDEVLDSSAILATNTSSISITKLGAVTKRPENVVGIHFMNPVPIMKLVEVIRGLLTSEETYKTALDLTSKLNKQTITAQDAPGFVINRILCPMINEAIFTLESGIASVEDIDKGMKLGTNVPMGPLELADFIGLDTVLSIMQVLHEGLGESKFRPAPLLRKYVDAGLYGRKSGRGFYTYEK